jgi:hypothetical protein
MPTTPQKARRLLKAKKVKVVQRLPFMIQLKFATGETVNSSIRNVSLVKYGKGFTFDLTNSSPP